MPNVINAKVLTEVVANGVATTISWMSPIRNGKRIQIISAQVVSTGAKLDAFYLRRAGQQIRISSETAATEIQRLWGASAGLILNTGETFGARVNDAGGGNSAYYVDCIETDVGP